MGYPDGARRAAPPEFETSDDGLGNRTAPAGANASQATAYLSTEVLPALLSCENHLQLLASGFSLPMTDSETANRWTTVDFGDVQILRALGFAFQAAIRMNNTLDTDGGINDLLNLENQKKFKAEHILKLLPNLLKRRSGSDQRAAFKTAVQQANTRYQAGSAAIRTRVDTADNRHHLFYIGGKRARKEEELRENATGISQALDGPANWAGYTVNLTPLLTTATPYRDLLPRLKDHHAVASTAPDPTFEANFPGGTQAQANQILENNGLLFFINSFADWAAVFLGDQSASDQAPDADIDSDGFTNFAEYVFALDPLGASSPEEVATQGLLAGANPGDRHFALTFVRRKAPLNVTYRVWVCDDLTSWDTTEAQVELVGAPVPQADDVMEQVTYRLKLPVAGLVRKFLKVVANGF